MRQGMSRMLRSKEVCARAGCTYRQLDYWIRAGYLEPWMVIGEGGSGSVRLFERGQVAEVRRLKRRMARKRETG